MMPGENGLDLTRALRQQKAVPILLLTAMGEPETASPAWSSGADDYLAKPFEPRELVLRIQRILRRIAARRPKRPPPLRFGPLTFDIDRRQPAASGDGRYTAHAAPRADLLAALAQRAGDAVSREDLSPAAPAPKSSRMVDVQMTRLRRKIEADPRFPRYLQTVRGRGYMLQPD